MLWSYFKMWQSLPRRERRLFVFSALLTLSTIFLTPLIAVCAFTGVGFTLNPAARIEGLPLWMDSAGAFLVLMVCLDTLLFAAMLGSLECILRALNRSLFKPSF